MSARPAPAGWGVEGGGEVGGGGPSFSLSRGLSLSPFLCLAHTPSWMGPSSRVPDDRRVFL